MAANSRLNIVILTGAGISAESGVKTFRDDGGLWDGHDVQQVATPEAFRLNPGLVLTFCAERRAQVQGSAPVDAHVARARLERASPGAAPVATPTVDRLPARP